MALINLRSLYQALILDNANQPQNKHEISDATITQTVHNPSCGDTINLFIKLKNDQIEDISFTGSGCSISQASASILTQTIKGKSREEAVNLVKIFSDLTIGKSRSEEDIESLGDAAILTEVMQFPARIKCATISWWALDQALFKKGKEND